MFRMQRLFVILSTLTALALLAGCGSDTPANRTDLSSSTPEPSPTTGGRSTGAAGGGTVTLQSDTRFYHTGDTITVTLSNQSNQTIYFPDQLTNCTVILLQRSKVQPKAGDVGQGTSGQCGPAIASRMHSLGSGQRLVVRLVASSGGWVPGLYRASLSYRTSLDAGPSTTISSAVFTVGPLVPQKP